MNYVDFDLSLEPSEGKYRACVCSPGGEGESQFTSPFSEQDLRIFRLEATRARTDLRRMESTGMKAAREFGEKLYQAVFTGLVRDCLTRSLDGVVPGETGLRIRVDLSKTPELVNLPWEYLYEPSQKRFLALSEDTPVVRYLELPDRIKPVPVKPPVRVLVVIASPKDKAPLDSAREFKKLKDALGTLVQNGMVELDLLERPTFKVLLRALKRKPYHIFHFVGHGQFDDECHEGLLLFEDEEGNGDPVSAQALGVLLRDEPSLRLAVLNACEGARVSSCDLFGGTAQTLIQQGIPAVIAMQAEISDESAQNFAETFYSALATGSAVDAALADVRKIIYGEGSVEWGTPVLYMRSADGRVFDVDRMSVEIRRRDRIAELSREVEEAVTATAWPVAIQRLKDLVGLDPANLKAAERLRFVEQQAAKPAPGSALTVPVAAVEIRAPVPAPAPAHPVSGMAPDDRAGSEPLETPASASAWRGPALLLAALFLANLVETSAETWLQAKYDLGLDSSHRIAYAVHSLESRVSFENHDLADPIAVYGYSIAYFFIFPLLGLAVAFALARRKDPRPFRLFAVAVAIDYLVSLPFFLFFPVPERWAFPDSGAMLLSDRWSSRLIEMIRPISGLDNCFPSSHVSLTVVLIAFCYLYRFRFRATVLALGTAVILSTFVLGIHWIADILAGVSVGALSVSLARIAERRNLLARDPRTRLGLRLARLSETVKARLSAPVRRRSA
ncbi:MAG: CHAT domain-containing protein [Acidobacteria bacterium]|nr:CHAT domain-containing protein [Acidobacteriota bacterium]MCA1611684.1 CHAT domain-containing protein [Acidobacteriota bacterium]